MIEGLRPYPGMKPSGLPWLGDIPIQWDVRRNGRLFGPRRETGYPELPILEVSLRSGVRVRDFENGVRKQEMTNRSKYQRAARGDIAYNMMRMWQGAVGIAPVDGLVSPAYVVARPFTDVDAGYYVYLFRTATYMREVDVFSRGIVPDRNRLYWESFKQIPSAYPPLDEQRLIVRFLDWHGAQTAKLIRAKKRVIALLNEQKQAIIHRAVTRGLDASVKLESSGIRWLGAVPTGWNLKRFKYLARIRSGQVNPRLDAIKSEILIAPNHIESGSGKIIRLQTADEQGADSGKYEVCGGEIIYSKIRPALRKATIAPCDCLCSADMYPIEPKSNEIIAEFLLLVMLSDNFTRYAVDCSMRVAMPKINRDALADCWISYPSLDEQAAILSATTDETSRFEGPINGARQEITLLNEFRARLIADIVTGKLDVRAAAVGLPEVTEGEPVEDIAEDGDLDEATDDPEKEEVAA